MRKNSTLILIPRGPLTRTVSHTVENLLDLVHHEEHTGIGRRRPEQTRHQTRVEPLHPALLIQLRSGVHEPFVLSIALVDRVRHHRALDDVDGVEQGPVEEPAEPAREHDLVVPSLTVRVLRRQIVLGVLERAEVNRTRG